MKGKIIKNNSKKMLMKSILTVGSLFFMLCVILALIYPMKAFAAVQFSANSYYSSNSVTAGTEKQIIITTNDKNFKGVKPLTIKGYENTSAGAGTITYFKDSKGTIATTDLDVDGTTTIQAYFDKESTLGISGTIVSIKLNKAGKSKLSYSVNNNTTEVSYVVNPVQPSNLAIVTFKDHNENVIYTQRVKYGDKAVEPKLPEIEGYTFKRWNKNFDKITEDTTIIAQCVPNTYTVTFKDCDGTTLKTQKVNYGGAATAPVVQSRTGYIFTGWDKPFNKVASNLVVTAQYKAKAFTVIFKDYNGDVLKTECVSYGEAATAPTVSDKTGYTFAGWDKSCSKVTSDLVIIAQYKLATNTVTFKDYDGTVLKTQTVNYGCGATAPANPSRIGYTFIGWDKYFNKVIADIVVTAKYKINTYTVIFKDYNGVVLKTQCVNYGESATAPTVSNKQGYTFSGWNKSFDKVTSDLIVTAQYKVATYTVTFKDYDGTVLNTQVVNYGCGAAAPTDPIRKGYTFTGWDKSFNKITSDTVVTATYKVNSYNVTFKDYDGTVLNTESVIYEDAATAPVEPKREGYTFSGWDKDYSKITEDTVVTAQYKINTYTVTFVDHGGKEITEVKVNHGDTAQAPTDPTRAGYTFINWDKQLTNIIENTTVTAQYTASSYTVIFKGEDGKELKKETVKYEEAVTAPEAPNKVGYTFIGWDKTFDKITEDTVVTAQYKINTYTVTFVDYDGKEITVVKVNYGDTALAPSAPIRIGYTFTGWDKMLTNITEDVTVTAQYTTSSYIVIFKDDNGKEFKREPVKYGEAATAPENPSKVGYTFTGWDKTFNKITEDTVVMAQYKINTYTVTFKDDKGTVVKTEIVNYGSGATAPIVPGRYGYTFSWDKQFNYITEDTTLTAQFTIIKYNLTVINGNGSGTYNISTTVTAIPTVPEGKYFAGWKDETGSIIRYCNPYVFKLYSNKTLTAIFSDTQINYEPNISMENSVIKLNIDEVKGYMYFASTISIPKPYEFIECGVVMSRLISTDLTKENADKTVVSPSQNTAGQWQTAFSASYGETLYVRSYIQYKDSNGNVIIKYSINTVKATMSGLQREVMIMRKLYESPEAHIEEFELTDILCNQGDCATSGNIIDSPIVIVN
jgi:hypothetical protein